MPSSEGRGREDSNRGGAALLVSGTAFAQKDTAIRFALDWRFEGPAAPYFVASGG